MMKTFLAAGAFASVLAMGACSDDDAKTDEAKPAEGAEGAKADGGAAAAAAPADPAAAAAAAITADNATDEAKKLEAEIMGDTGEDEGAPE